MAFEVKNRPGILPTGALALDLLSKLLLLQATLVQLVLLPSVVSATQDDAHILSRQTLASCQYDSDCIENAYCWNQQTCLCKDGYLVDRNRTHVQCLKIAVQIGDPCSMDVQCRVTFAAQAQCRDGACGCSVASHFQAGRCYETKRIGQICQVSNNCLVEDSQSYCVSGVCACPFQRHPNENGTRCLRSSFLGDQCSGDEECVAMNSRCFNVCRCRVDHVISTDQKRCLKAANTLGEPCEENSQCQAFLSNSQCNDGRCGCVSYYHQRGPICVQSIMLNQACTDHRHCVTLTHKDSNSTEVTSVDCIDGSCTCAVDYIMTENLLDCVRYSENGSSRRNFTTKLTLILLSLHQIHKFFI